MAKTDEVNGLEHLLDYLMTTRNFDFRAYKRPTLTRRIDRRMQTVKVSDYADYQELLRSDPSEFGELFDTVLINVTNFFRDELPWEFLASDVVPQLLENKDPREPIRAWSAGCATGQEAYSLAMVLAEALGLDEFRARVKIYATDVDDSALMAARQAIYSEAEVAEVPEAMRARYFEVADGGYAFRKDVRRSVVFGRHDLLQDAPISRIDILVCRNTLMYFNVAAQSRILARFHFALSDGGFLFLGRAETLLAHSSTFVPFDLKRRVFRKVPSLRLENRLMLMRDGENGDADVLASTIEPAWQAAFDAATVPQIVIDHHGWLVFANQGARDLLGINETDIGRPFHDLEISYKPAELRSLMTKAYAERRTLDVNSIEWTRGANDDRWLDLQLVPLYDGTGRTLGITIAFIDITIRKRLEQQLARSAIELESAYQQLQSTNEELETTNEELQSTVEELETTNEELQSTNEELETMNEELQSTNEELSTVNDMARQYTGELDSANQFLESIFSGLGQRIIVVDNDLKVRLWNRGAEDLWGVRSEEVIDVPLTEVDSGLPAQELAGYAKSVLSTDSRSRRVEMTVTNRRGRPVKIAVTVAALPRIGDAEARGVIFLLADLPPEKV